MALVIVEHAATQGIISRGLVGFRESRIDAIALGVYLGAQTFVKHLPHHFGHILGVNGVLAGRVLDHREARLLRLRVLRVGDFAEHMHAPQHIELPLLGALGVGDRIVARRRFGQAREHCGLGQVDVL